MDRPGYTIVGIDILRNIINPMDFDNVFGLMSPHGEIIYDDPPLQNTPVLAMCYSAPPITVNYSNEDDNKRVLQIVDDNLHSSLRRLSFTIRSKNRRRKSVAVAFSPEHRASQSRIHNPNHFKKIIALDSSDPISIYKELTSLASAIKRGDTVHEKSIRMVTSIKPGQVNDSRKSRIFSQSFPVTKMINADGAIIPLRMIEHPNKRYSLRADDDTIPETASGNFEYKISLFIQNPFYKKERTGISGITTTNYGSRRTPTAGYQSHYQKYIEKRAAPTGSNIDFQRYIEEILGLIVVTKENWRDHQDIFKNVIGQYVELILGEYSEILKFWKGVILLPINPRKSGDVVTYYMLPYRFHKLSGVHCVVFDLWHILCYASPVSAYSVGGVSTTTTRDYMDLLRILGIKLVMCVDLTCNVPGVKTGAWPLLTYDQIIKNLQFQERFFQNIGSSRFLSSRLDPTYDILPHFFHVSTELNNFLKEIKTAFTVPQVLESIHPKGRLLSRREREFSSTDIESYIGLYEYVKRLCGKIGWGESCVNEQANLVVKKNVGDGPEEIMSQQEVCELHRLVVPLQSVNRNSIGQLRKYLRDNNITFSINPSKMQLLKDTFPLYGTNDVPESYTAVFNSALRLWTVPSLKYSDHIGKVPCFYHMNLNHSVYHNNFETEITSNFMIKQIRKAREEPIDHRLGEVKYTIVGFLDNSGVFKASRHFEEWWDLYKEQHRLMFVSNSLTWE